MNSTLFSDPVTPSCLFYMIAAGTMHEELNDVQPFPIHGIPIPQPKSTVLTGISTCWQTPSTDRPTCIRQRFRNVLNIQTEPRPELLQHTHVSLL